MMGLLLINGNIRTMDANGTLAQAVGIRKGHIDIIGSTQQVLQTKTQKDEVIDLDGKTVFPGFIDAHNHMIYYGTELMGINCRAESIRSIDDIVKEIAKKVASLPPGQWLRGYGYDDAVLDEGRHPRREDLDRVSPQNPVVLYRTCGHMLVANSKALQICGITKNTADPPGGEIDRDPATGEPTGLMKETAQEFIKNSMDPFTVEELVEAVEVAGTQYLSEGITSVQEAGVGYFQTTVDEMKTYQMAQLAGRLRQRVCLYLLKDVLPQLSSLGIIKGFGDDMLRIGGIKFFADGVPSAHTGAVREPYANAPDETGILYLEKDELTDTIATIHRSGLQSSIHAIGDRAIDVVLDAYENVLKIMPREDHRHRIEHFTMASPDLIERAKSLGIIPVVAATEVPFYGDAFIKNLGPKRAEWCYPLRSMLDSELPVALSTDRPFDPVGNPLFSVQAAVERKTRSGHVIGKAQCIRVEEAFRMHTNYAAFAAFEEKIKGSIELGKLGDFVVYPIDPFEVDIDELSQVPVTYTIVGGDVVYSGKD
jgi:predicted amidohydrolase YtcJ